MPRSTFDLAEAITDLEDFLDSHPVEALKLEKAAKAYDEVVAEIEEAAESELVGEDDDEESDDE